MVSSRKGNKKLLIAGGALLLLFFLLRKGREFDLSDLFGGAGAEENEEENPYTYPDYSSWLDRNKILLDPGVSGSGNVAETGIYPETTTQPIIYVVTYPSESGTQTVTTATTPTTATTESEGFPDIGTIGDILFTGLVGGEAVRRIINWVRSRQKPPKPPTGGVPTPTPEDLNFEVRKPAVGQPKPEPEKLPIRMPPGVNLPDVIKTLAGVGTAIGVYKLLSKVKVPVRLPSPAGFTIGIPVLPAIPAFQEAIEKFTEMAGKGLKSLSPIGVAAAKEVSTPLSLNFEVRKPRSGLSRHRSSSRRSIRRSSGLIGGEGGLRVHSHHSSHRSSSGRRYTSPEVHKAVSRPKPSPPKPSPKPEHKHVSLYAPGGISSVRHLL